MDIETTRIRRRPDGSIDTDYYIAIGHLARAEQARALFGRAKKELRAPSYPFSRRMAPAR